MQTPAISQEAVELTVVLPQPPIGPVVISPDGDIIAVSPHTGIPSGVRTPAWLMICVCPSIAQALCCPSCNGPWIHGRHAAVVEEMRDGELLKGLLYERFGLFRLRAG